MSLQLHFGNALAMTDILMKNRFEADPKPASHQQADSTLRVFPAHLRLG